VGFNLKVLDKRIVVTGAGSGIGRQVALQLLEKGAFVVGADINLSGLEQTKIIAQENGYDIEIHQLDITDLEGVRNFYHQVLEINETIDGLINVAGIIQPFLMVETMEYHQIDKVFKVNFYGTLQMIKEILPHLKSRPEAHIVNVSSMGAFLPVLGQTIYGGSKAAVSILSEGLYAELKATNVHVTSVIPGGVRTDIIKNANPNQGYSEVNSILERILLSPERAAKIIIRGMENNRFRVYAGTDSKFMNMIYTVFPKSAIRMITKQLKKNFGNIK